MFKVTHGDHGTRLYRIWKNMKYRCNNPNSPAYEDYGGRGISVCDEWQSYVGFREWAIANGYNEHLTIDRKENNKGYCPDNCRWATPRQQGNNTRRNRVLEFNGEVKTLSEWAGKTGICVATLWERLNSGWSAERALTEPVHNNGRKTKSFFPNCGAKMDEEEDDGQG